MKRAWLAILAIMVLLSGGLLAPGRPAASGQEEALSLADLVFVTTGPLCTGWPDCDGCLTPSVLSVHRDEPVWRGKYVLGSDAHRLAASRDFSVLLAVGSYTSVWPGKRYERLRTSVHLVRRTSDDWWHWESQTRIFSDDVAPTGGIAFLPDGDSFLVGTCGLRPPQFPEVPPYGVAKYRLSEIEPFESEVGQEWQLGRRRGYLRLSQLAKLIVVTADGRQAHILTADGFVRTIDPATMAEIAPAIQLQPDHPVSLKLPLKVGLNYDGDLTADERYLVTSGLTTEDYFLNVADLVERRTWTVPLPENTLAAAVVINKGWLNHGLLAIWTAYYREPLSDVSYAIVYRFQPAGPLEEVGRFKLQFPFGAHPDARYSLGAGPAVSPLAWSASGGELIVANDICPVPGEGPWCEDPEHSAEWTILTVEQDGRVLLHQRDITACQTRGAGDIVNSPEYVLTANGRITPPVTPSPVPSPSATATPTSSPQPSCTATPWPTPSLSSTPSPTPVSSPTPTSRASQPLRPVYLPLAARSSCQLRRQFADVALVLDASTSMRQPTSAGRSKLVAAQEAALSFANLLALRPDAQGNHDRLALVVFNDDAWILSPLGNDLAAVRAALARVPDYVAEGTRLDLALAHGLAALEAAPRRTDNLPALILLTDGLPNRVPTPTPTGSQEDTILGWAQRARSRGVSVYTIGLGEPNPADPLKGIDIPLLRAIATRPEMFHHAPDAEALAGIYRQIAPTIGCPPGGL